MTTADACQLLVESVRDLSAARDEAEAYRLLLQVALQHAHEQHVELQRTKAAYYQLLDEARELRRARAAA